MNIRAFFIKVDKLEAHTRQMQIMLDKLMQRVADLENKPRPGRPRKVEVEADHEVGPE